MKFSRILALSMAAVAAFSFTACDSTSSSDSAAGVTVVSYAAGTQSHLTDGSFISLRGGIAYNAGYDNDSLNKANSHKGVLGVTRGGVVDSARWKSIDIIVWADSTASTQASFFSPKRVSEVFAGSNTGRNMPAAAKIIDTKFVKIAGASFSDYATAQDITDEAANITATQLNNQVQVNKGDVLLAQLTDGSWAVVNVVELSSNGPFNIGLQIKSAK